MTCANDQVEELQQLYPGVTRHEEGGVTYFYIPHLPLPAGCKPGQTQALLCPTVRDGYPSRLFLADRVQAERATPNWLAGGARILERNWHVYSWKVHRSNLRLAQLVSQHLRALR